MYFQIKGFKIKRTYTNVKRGIPLVIWISSFLLFILCSVENFFVGKHVTFIILLRRLLQSENLNSPKGSNSRFIALHYARKISKICLLFAKQPFSGDTKPK